MGEAVEAVVLEPMDVERTDVPSESSIGTEVPEHLQQMLEHSKSFISTEQFNEVKEVISSFQDVFASHTYDIGCFQEIEHKIDTRDAPPVKQRMRRTPIHFAKEEEAEVNKMLQAGVIESSISEWASAPVLVRKRDGTVRFCVDYRALNDITVKDVYPLPLVGDCVEAVAGSQWFSKLDALWGYWQIKICDDDKRKTAFITKYGLFEFVKMPFGLCNAPATYSRVIDLILKGINWKTALAFLDDIVILGQDFNAHLSNLKEALARFRRYRIKLKPKKCLFFQRKIEFLGRIVSNNSLEMSNSDIKVVKDWTTPKCSKDVERFLGLANYHRGFIKDFARLAVPLYRVTGQKNFIWGEEQVLAFHALKESLTQPPVLALPNSDDEFILDTDASDEAIGGELLQLQEGEEKVIAYASFALTSEQRRYCTTRKELLAIVRLTRQFRHYLLGKPFTVRTDHNSLTWLLRFKEPQGQLARWIEELGQYNMIVRHRKGKLHTNADALSRSTEGINHYIHGVSPQDLPCGGCKYCLRAHSQWAEFIDDVDDVVPISRCELVSAQCVEPRVMGSGETEPGSPVTVEVCINLKSVTISTLTEEGIATLTTKVSNAEERQVWGYSVEEICKAQSEDPDLRLVLDWLILQSEPAENVKFMSSAAAKFYWINKERLCLRDRVLFIKRKDSEEQDLVLPKSLIQVAIQVHHDLPSAGHQGMNRTLHRLKEKFYWYGINKEVETYVATCGVCNQNKKPSRRSRYPLVEYHSGVPMEKVHIDFLWPLRRTVPGNKSILVMVDQFSKWVALIALPSQTAEGARAAVDSFFSRLGVPLQIVSDQGRNFESKLFTELCEVLHIH